MCSILCSCFSFCIHCSLCSCSCCCFCCICFCSFCCFPYCSSYSWNVLSISTYLEATSSYSFCLAFIFFISNLAFFDLRVRSTKHKRRWSNWLYWMAKTMYVTRFRPKILIKICTVVYGLPSDSCSNSSTSSFFLQVKKNKVKLIF